MTTPIIKLTSLIIIPIILSTPFGHNFDNKIKVNLVTNQNNIQSNFNPPESSENPIIEITEIKEFTDNIDQQILYSKKLDYISKSLEEINVLNNNNYGLYFRTFNDNFIFAQNEYKYYTAASTTKVPYSMLYIDDINEGKYTLKTYIRGYSLQNMLYNTIVNSNNYTTDILKQNRQNIRQEILKYTPHKKTYLAKNNLVAPIYMANILDTIYHDESYSYLVDLMKKAPDYYNIYPGSYPFATKWGYYNNTISQIGIVYSDNPYMIILYNKNSGNTSLQNFHKIGKIFENASNITIEKE